MSDTAMAQPIRSQYTHQFTRKILLFIDNMSIAWLNFFYQSAADMWKACLGQLSELQQDALQQALEAESWINLQPWTRARHPNVQISENREKTASRQQRFLELFSWNAPIFCLPLAMKTERLWFCMEWKRTNTTKYTEMDSRERRQLILLFYMWTAIVDNEIRKKNTREPEELWWREVQITLRLE